MSLLYACALYVDQLEAGGNYATLRPAISICLLPKVLFRGVSCAHHRFRLVDREHARELSDTVEVHTLELTKYNLSESTISDASAIEQWAFFLLLADRYEPARLRELLPGPALQQAITALEAITAKTEDRAMYDQRKKALRDHQWALDSARGWTRGRTSERTGNRSCARTGSRYAGGEDSATPAARRRNLRFHRQSGAAAN
jgi:predicted transposase/invertase (TIGR01784 family)